MALSALAVGDGGVERALSAVFAWISRTEKPGRSTTSMVMLTF